jgi:hypothetical protein
MNRRSLLRSLMGAGAAAPLVVAAASTTQGAAPAPVSKAPAPVPRRCSLRDREHGVWPDVSLPQLRALGECPWIRALLEQAKDSIMFHAKLPQEYRPLIEDMLVLDAAAALRCRVGSPAWMALDGAQVQVVYHVDSRRVEAYRVFQSNYKPALHYITCKVDEVVYAPRNIVPRAHWPGSRFYGVSPLEELVLAGHARLDSEGPECVWFVDREEGEAQLQELLGLSDCFRLTSFIIWTRALRERLECPTLPVWYYPADKDQWQDGDPERLGCAR